MVSDDLSASLASFQQNPEIAKNLVRMALQDSADPKGTGLMKSVELKIKEEVEGSFIYAEAETAFYSDYEQANVEFASFDLVDLDGTVEVEIVKCDGLTIVAKIEATVEVNASASFTFQIKDEGDYITIGGSRSYRSTDFPVDVLLTLDQLPGGSIVPTEIEVLGVPDTIDFGYVEPEFDEEDRE